MLDQSGPHDPTLHYSSSWFSSLGFKLVLDFDFCIRKNFINTVRLKLLRKEEQIKNKLSMNNETDLFMLSQQIKTDKV